MPPTAPPNLRAVSIGSDYIVVEWKPPESNGAEINSYAVDLKQEGEKSFVNKYLGQSLTYVACNLHPGTAYLLRVCASNDAGTGPFSVVLVVRTRAHRAVSICEGETLSQAPLRVCGDWAEYFDTDSNLCYYENKEMQIKQWEKPDVMKNLALESEDSEMAFRKKRFNLMKNLKGGALSPKNSNYSKNRVYMMKVRREHLLSDSMSVVKCMTYEEMRLKMKVSYEGEEGVDAGGLTKDWYMEISKELFQPQVTIDDCRAF